MPCQDQCMQLNVHNIGGHAGVARTHARIAA